MIMTTEEHAKAINRAVFPGLQGGPLMHIIAAKAVALKEAQSEEFTSYQRQIYPTRRVSQPAWRSTASASLPEEPTTMSSSSTSAAVV